MNIIGIDLGTSLAKIIECDKELNIINKMISLDKDLEKVFDNFVTTNNIELDNIEKVVLTGVGSSKFDKEKLRRIPTTKVNEFFAVATGGLELSKREEGTIVSMGTGTALVKVEGNEIKHLGGTGVGGATLVKLANRIAGTNNFNEIIELSFKGSLKNVDLTIGDVTVKEIEGLPKDITAANFGKLNGKANDSDVILGIINMILETIGMLTVLATKDSKSRDVILIGSVTKIPYIYKVIEKFKSLCDLKFIVPDNAEYAVAIGAIKNYLKPIDK